MVRVSCWRVHRLLRAPVAGGRVPLENKKQVCAWVQSGFEAAVELEMPGGTRPVARMSRRAPPFRSLAPPLCTSAIPRDLAPRILIPLALGFSRRPFLRRLHWQALPGPQGRGLLIDVPPSPKNPASAREPLVRSAVQSQALSSRSRLVSSLALPHVPFAAGGRGFSRPVLGRPPVF